MDQQYSKEDLLYNRSLKKGVFDTLLRVTETFYIHCKNHPRLFIGSRGLTDKEKTEGIILVFGPYSYRKLNYDEKGINCEMNFGKWEEVYLPFESVYRIFDKAGHFFMQFVTMEFPDDEDKESPAKLEEKVSSSNVIAVDFTKQKKKSPEKKQES